MRDRKSLSPPESTEPSASDRLDSWKEIAAYLKRDESTVRRWEKEGLPVQRHVHMKKATVYAYKSAIDVWWNDGRARLELTEAAANAPRRRLTWWVAAGLTLLSIGIVGLNVGRVRDRLLGRPVAGAITSIAVLPLENLSGDPGQDYFADGMTEALTTELAQISALTVISRSSAMKYKGGRTPPPQIAKDLKVDAVIEGAVQRSGDKVSITVQLIDAPADRHLWARSFQREYRDILTLQQEMAQAIAAEIRVKLTPQEQTRLASARPVNPEAYEAYLVGRRFLAKGDRESLMKAIQYFQQAIEKDGGYALAYGGLARSYVRLGDDGFMAQREALGKAKEAALSALRLDDELADAHVSLASVWGDELSWSSAEREYQRAIELNPSFALAHHWYSFLLIAVGEPEKAVAEVKRAQELDPLSPRLNANVGVILYYARHYDEAVKELRAALELDPNHAATYDYLGMVYLQKGLYAEAIAALKKSAELGEPFARFDLASAYAMAGQRAEAMNILRELHELSKRDYVDPQGLVFVYAGLGDTDQVFAWLERAFEARSAVTTRLRDPRLDSLRSDPRYQDLLRRLHFPP